jgi:hypothetical protein
VGGSDLLLAWRSAPLGVFVVGWLQTTLLYGPTCSVHSGVTAMITEAFYSDNLRPALACVNNQPERTARWPELWMIHRPDGSFAMYLVNWGVRSAANVQPSTTRLPELTDPDVMTALTFPQPANKEGRFVEWL